ncbi:MAG TPA: hypothetical protein VNO32_01260 [Candidatus Acidoferrum sp.]|jgi:hypothetical protein|nr:hypothetical protein [Candidatus Acidoferrum sp.]
MNPTRKSLLLAVVLFCSCQPCKSQDMQMDRMRDEHANYWLKWDTAQERMIAYGNSSDPSAPAGRIFGRDGHSVAIYPLRDLAESASVNLWDAAATPEGGMILAGIVGYGPPESHLQTKSVLLTYSPVGKLEKVWNVAPYEFDLVAVDGQGNVYGLGNADLEEPYDILVKYSPEGKVLKQFLSTSLFSVGAHILSPGGGTKGLNQMFIQDQVLFVWFARTEELLRFSLSGDLLNRASLANSLKELAAANGDDGIVLRSLAPSGGDQVIVEVVLWDTRTATTSARPILVELSPNGPSAAPLPFDMHSNRFLGKSSTGKLVLLERSSGIVRTY